LYELRVDQSVFDVFASKQLRDVKNVLLRARKKAARSAEEMHALIEAGFEYVLQKDGLAYFRKRK